MAYTTALENAFSLYWYAKCIHRAGDYIFLIATDADLHIRVARFDAATMEPHGAIDLGYLGHTDTGHVYPTMLIDPTDNKVVVIKAGRYDTPNDVRSVLWKSAHAYGGTNAEWAANDFGASVNIPYPASGFPSYALSFFTDNGTMVMFCGNRDSANNGTPPSRGVMMYRASGATAAALCSGTWTEVVKQPTDLNPYNNYISGTVYAGRPCRKGANGVALAFSMYWYRYTGSPYDQWGVSYIECDDVTVASPVWKMVDGTVWSTGRKYDLAARTSAVLTPWQGNTSYHHATVLDNDGRPVIGYARVTMDAQYNLNTTAEIWVMRWNGSSWQHEFVASPAHNIDWPTLKPLRSSGITTFVSNQGVHYTARDGGQFAKRDLPQASDLGFIGGNDLIADGDDVLEAHIVSVNDVRSVRISAQTITDYAPAGGGEPDPLPAMNVLMMGAGF